jgi:hypothetical protein
VPLADLRSASPQAMPDRIGNPCYDADHVGGVRNGAETVWKSESALVGLAPIGQRSAFAGLEAGEKAVGASATATSFRSIAFAVPALCTAARRSSRPNWSAILPGTPYRTLLSQDAGL